jgi:hypothetical protein
MVGTNGMHDTGGFTKFFGQLGSDHRMGTLDFMVNGLTDIVKQPHAPGQFFLQPQFRGHNTTQHPHFHRMLKNILGVTGSVFQPPQVFDQFGMDPMDTQIKRGLFAGFFNGRVHLLTDLFDHILDAAG